MITKGKATAILMGMMMTFCLTGCGADTKNAEGESTVKESTENTVESTKAEEGVAADSQTAAGGYQFEVNGVKVAVDMDMDTVNLGDAKSVFEAPSCAGQGTAYVYDFGSYEIETYPSDDKNLIGFIILKDDTVATAEGIDLSKTKDDIISAYGDGYTETDNGLSYASDDMKLNFIFDGEDIVSIEYVSSVVG